MMEADALCTAVHAHNLQLSNEWLALLEVMRRQKEDVRVEQTSWMGIARMAQTFGSGERVGPAGAVWSDDLHRYVASEARRAADAELLEAHDAVCQLLRIDGYDLPANVAERLG